MNKADLLNTALDAVTDRGKEYGHTTSNFRHIADYWSLRILHRYGVNVALDQGDVAAMLIFVKMARLEHSPDHTTSKIDIAGLAACWSDVYHTEVLDEPTQAFTPLDIGEAKMNMDDAND